MPEIKDLKTVAETVTPPTPPVVIIPKKAVNKTDYYTANAFGRLGFADEVIDGLLRVPQMQQMMEPYGYTPEKVSLFQAVYLKAREAQNNQMIERAETVISYKEFEILFSAVKSELSCLVKIAKVALKNELEYYDLLCLNARKGKSSNDIYGYMDFFYSTILGSREIVSLLTQYGYDQPRIAANQQEFLKAKAIHYNFRTENAESVEATRIRDLAMDELNEWMYDYYALEKVARIQRPDLVTPPAQ